VFRFTDLIIFRMTRDCNLNCKYCFMQNKGEFKGEIIEFELLQKIILRIVEQRVINNLQNQPIQLVLHGGEVLLLGEKRLYDILEFITKTFVKNDIKYTLACQTNATLLDDKIAKVFSLFEVNVGLSFDGIGDSNSSRTDIKQEIFENKFEILKNNKCKYGFLIVASKKNIDNMQKTQEYLENLGIEDNNAESIVKGYKINYCEDMINPGENSEIEVSGSEMFNKVWKPELDRFLIRKKTIEFHVNELLTKTLVDILTYHTNQTRSGCGTKWCGAGLCMIAVEPDGEMDYCDRYSKKFPEAYVQHSLDYDFLGIYQLKKAIDYNVMKKNLYKKYGCNTCIADYICDHGCESFYKSKFNEYGIDIRIVCDQHKDFYNYVLNNIEKFLQVYCDNNKSIRSKDVIFKTKLITEKLNFNITTNEYEIFIGRK